MVRAAELLEQVALPVEQLGGRSGEPVLGAHVDADEIAFGPLRDPGRPADEPLTVRGAGEGDEHPLPGLPGPVDSVPGAVLG